MIFSTGVSFEQEFFGVHFNLVSEIQHCRLEHSITVVKILVELVAHVVDWLKRIALFFVGRWAWRLIFRNVWLIFVLFLKLKLIGNACRWNKCRVSIRCQCWSFLRHSYDSIVSIHFGLSFFDCSLVLLIHFVGLCFLISWQSDDFIDRSGLVNAEPSDRAETKSWQFLQLCH